MSVGMVDVRRLPRRGKTFWSCALRGKEENNLKNV